MRHLDGNWLKPAVVLAVPLAAVMANAQVATTTVQGIVYRADGTAAQGTMLVSWPAFVTAANQSVAAGQTTATIGSDGTATLQLAPNVGASPAGTYYTVVYQLNDGTTSTEYWTVPAAASATIASVRAQLMPSTVAVQTVSKSYVDALVSGIAPTAQNYLPLAGGTMAGPLTLSSDPVVSTQASTKHYVDAQTAALVPLAGGTVTGTLTTAKQVTALPLVNVEDGAFAGGADPTGVNDSTAAITAAIAFALAQGLGRDADYPEVYFPAGHYLVNGTLRVPGALRLAGDNEASAILQETSATANLITVYPNTTCGTDACYGSIEKLTLEGSGKTTAGTLLELDTGFTNLTQLQFFNNAGRGLQMNAGSERVTGRDLSFYEVRWPLILGGDSNEDYFYNTHILSAGQTAEIASTQPVVNHNCYSVNCTNGMFAAAGTTAAPTSLTVDPHGSIDIDKAVNVSFLGGSVKDDYMLSGVKVWGGIDVRFQNMYHEGTYFSGDAPSINHDYIVGGAGERTYLTGTLSGTGVTVAVANAAWMPQYFGLATDAALDDGDYYPYVILPQDFNPESAAPSAYVTGVKQNQYELVNAEGFSADGMLHIQPGGRNQGGSAPAGTQWPAGSVVEEWFSQSPYVELNNVHMNLMQGPLVGNGWSVHCSETDATACGEVVVGTEPDVESQTALPATNQVGVYTQIGDANDPIQSGSASLKMAHVEMFTAPTNQYVGTVVAAHRASLTIDGTIDPERTESVVATQPTAAGAQISIGAATGGNVVLAPMYANGQVAQVTVSMPNGEVQWDTLRGVYQKHTAIFAPYGQYGLYEQGLQYQGLYCIFDTPTADGGHVQNRFCNGGGPNNAGISSAPGYGAGFGYDSWNGSNWVSLFKVNGQNGAGSLNAAVPATFGSAVGVAGALTASRVNGAITVDGTTYTTLNAAWAAAVSAATASGRDQTVWLGPGVFPVSATLAEPANGACVSVVGSAGTTSGADVGSTATTLTVPSALNGDVFFLGNAVLTEGCTFRDLNVLAGKNATHGFELQWARGLLLDTVSVNDTTAEGVLLGEESTTNGHQTSGLLTNVTVSYSAAAFTPATRPQWGVHLQQTAIDSTLRGIVVRNAQTAAVWNEGTGNTGYGVHGFGYPYTCTTAPCSNSAASSTAANASYASSYVIYDTGGGGTVWTDTYLDSPAIAGFFIGANGVAVHGGHLQWPELGSFPAANLAYVSASVTNNLLLADSDYAGQTGFVGSPVSAAYVTSAAAVGGDPDYVRRVSFNVARVVSVGSDGGLHLANALPGGVPSATAKLQQVIALTDREGGGFFQEWSGLFIAEGVQGERLCFYYPRLQSCASSSEATMKLPAPLMLVRPVAQFKAMTVVDGNDGERIACYRTFFPAANTYI